VGEKQEKEKEENEERRISTHALISGREASTWAGLVVSNV
jgi:hypothetical protein